MSNQKIDRLSALKSGSKHNLLWEITCMCSQNIGAGLHSIYIVFTLHPCSYQPATELISGLRCLLMAYRHRDMAFPMFPSTNEATQLTSNTGASTRPWTKHGTSIYGIQTPPHLTTQFQTAALFLIFIDLLHCMAELTLIRRRFAVMAGDLLTPNLSLFAEAPARRDVCLPASGR